MVVPCEVKGINNDSSSVASDVHFVGTERVILDDDINLSQLVWIDERVV